MSILAALAKAYDRLYEKGLIAPFGLSSKDIHACLVLDPTGEMIGPPVLWHRDEAGKPASRKINVPYFGGRSGSKPPPYFLWDNTAYVLGVSAKENFDPSSRFLAFKELHGPVLLESSDPGLKAVFAFLQKWSPSRFFEAGFPDDLRDRNIVFRLASDRIFVHERPAAVEVWNKIYKPDTIGEGICLISGKTTAIARLHPPIISFDNPARIVSFDLDNDAFSSYGHLQAENAPTGIEKAFAYTATLNRFLEKDSGHRLQIGDASTVFWADGEHAEKVSLAETMFSVFFNDEDAEADLASVDEKSEAQKVGVRLKQIREGMAVADLDPGLASGVRFYVLALAPNAARLSVRFWLEDDFGTIARNYQRFISDMRVEPPPRDGYPALWKYLAETAVLKKRENVPPNLAGDWMRAILTGQSYPLTLLATVLMRLRADKDVNALRVGILKSLLIRNARREVPVALDPENTDKGYLLGQLFATYEHVQTAALGSKVNATIKDKFYGSASAQPRKVFALLDKGSANHLSKVGKQSPGRRVNLEKQIGAIMDRMQPDADPFPASLSAEEQALFGLGYYHQRNEFFKSKKDDTAAIEETDK